MNSISGPQYRVVSLFLKIILPKNEHETGVELGEGWPTQIRSKVLAKYIVGFSLYACLYVFKITPQKAHIRDRGSGLWTGEFV